MLRRLALVRADVSEDRIASFITVTRISEIGTTLAVTSKPTHAAKKYKVFIKSRRMRWAAHVDRMERWGTCIGYCRKANVKDTNGKSKMSMCGLH
jgi:hypothetical protein